MLQTFIGICAEKRVSEVNIKILNHSGIKTSLKQLLFHENFPKWRRCQKPSASSKSRLLVLVVFALIVAALFVFAVEGAPLLETELGVFLYTFT